MNKRLLLASLKALSSFLVVFSSFNPLLSAKTQVTPPLFKGQNSNNSLASQTQNHLNLRVWNTVLSVLSLVLNLLSIGEVGWFGYKAYQDITQKISSFSECKSKKNKLRAA